MHSNVPEIGLVTKPAIPFREPVNPPAIPFLSYPYIGCRTNPVIATSNPVYRENSPYCTPLTI